MIAAEGRHTGTDAADGLRGIAIALVIVHHTWMRSWVDPSATLFGAYVDLKMFAQAGFIGVDLFFFLSAFCLFFPRARALAGAGTPPTLSRFAAMRALKIVPSYVLALIPAWLLASHYFPDAAAAWQALGVHLIFAHNLSVDWIGQIDGVFWSLAIEVQFYLIFPLLASAFRRHPGLTFVALNLLAYAFRWHAFAFIGDEPRVRVLPAYLDVFAWGMAAAYALVMVRTRRARFVGPRWSPAWTLVAVAAVVGVVALMLDLGGWETIADGRVRWEMWHRGPLAALWFALLLGTQFGLASWRAAIVNPLTVWLSILSYNLYLWHDAIGNLMYRYHVPHHVAGDPHDDVVWQLSFAPVAVALAVGVAAGVTYFFERPILALAKPVPFRWQAPRRLGKRVERPNPT